MADSVALPDLAGHETARTPPRFRDRVILAFRAPANIDYLRSLFTEKVPPGPMRSFVLDTLDDSVYGYSDNNGRALEILADDPYGRRGGARPAISLWGEVRRINGVFYKEKLDFLRDYAALLERTPMDGLHPTGLRDGISEDDESYAMRMFTADSLRPDGWGHLNNPGPLYGILEDQARGSSREPFAAGPAQERQGLGDLAWVAAANRRAGGRPAATAPPSREAFAPGPRGGAPPVRREAASRTPPGRGAPSGPPPRREAFAGGPPPRREASAGGPPPSREAFASAARPPPGGWGHGYLGEPKPFPPLWVPADPEVFLYGSENAPWSTGDPERTPEMAVAQYWGDDGVLATEDGVAWQGAEGDNVSWGDWSESNGARFQRYDTIPFWQKGGHDGYDLDIEETLGTQARELDAHVRRWDMDRLREPRGQEYRRYGSRSGHMT